MAAMDAAIPEATDTKLTGRLQVTVEFVCHKPKTTKLTDPKGDIDNYQKSILDAVTKKGYWGDDVQVVMINAIKRFAVDSEIPHTHIVIEQL